MVFFNSLPSSCNLWVEAARYWGFFKPLAIELNFVGWGGRVWHSFTIAGLSVNSLKDRKTSAVPIEKP